MEDKHKLRDTVILAALAVLLLVLAVIILFNYSECDLIECP